MRETAVRAQGKDRNIQLRQLIVFCGNCRYFGGSDECEISRVKTQDYPAALEFRQADIPESALQIG